MTLRTAAWSVEPSGPTLGRLQRDSLSRQLAIPHAGPFKMGLLGSRPGLRTRKGGFHLDVLHRMVLQACLVLGLLHTYLLS